MWLGWIFASCVVLSAYDLCKKASVRDNAVFPVLFGSTLSGWLAVTVSLFGRGELRAAVSVPCSTVLLLLLKSVIVGASWTATYFALRTLPITSAAPIRATGPLWTLVGAVLLFAEVPTPLQAVGIVLTLAGCLFLSREERRQGADRGRMGALALAFLGTFLGSCSALYDKHLLQGCGIPIGAVLWWFLGGMAVIYALAVVIVRAVGDSARFVFRWTIPCVGVLLALSDMCYFNAVSVPDARISILSLVRRSSVVLTFLVGGAVFREQNLRRKACALAAILVGVLLLCLR